MNRALVTLVLFVAAGLAVAPANAQWFGWRGWGSGYWGGYGNGPICGGSPCCGAPACWGGLACCDYGMNGIVLGMYPYRPFVDPRFSVGYAVPPVVAPPVLFPSLDPAPVSALRMPSRSPAGVSRVSDLDRVLGRVASIESRRKAERMLTEGDELFRVQNFHSALQRYKLAASTAPDFAEAFWRKGHALIATHNYELAVAAFRRAIELGGDINREGFRLDDLYGPARMTKSVQVDALAEWALARTDHADAWFLVGITLYFDGQQPRAEKFLARAQALSGPDDHHIAAFSRQTTMAASKQPRMPAMTFGRDT